MPEVAEGVRNADLNQNQSQNRNQSFSMANITNFVSIKLNGENYLSWKHQVLTILKTLGLSKHVSADLSSPLESDPEYESWSKADCYVTACINATLDQSIAHLAIGTGTALDLWKVFCDPIKRVADSLRSIGEKVSKADLVLQTLQGLNSVFNTFVQRIFGPNPAEFGPTHFNAWASHQANYSGFSAQADTLADICPAVESWIPDSGATAHMTADPNLVHEAKVYYGPNKVVVGNDLHRDNSPPHSA